MGIWPWRVDFLAVVEHRLIPARVRSEWARLKASRWPPSGHRLLRIPLMLVMRGLVSSVCVALPFCFALHLLLPILSGSLIAVGRFGACCHLVRVGSVVLYGYQGADTDAEKLSLTEQLFDAALG